MNKIEVENLQKQWLAKQPVKAPVFVGKDVIIDVGVIVNKGVRIGDGAIVGASSVVAPYTIIPENAMVLGNPAKIVGYKKWGS